MDVGICVLEHHVQTAHRPAFEKKCWFAVLLPTHLKQALPKKIYCLSENIFFFSSSVDKLFFKIIKSCFLIKETVTETYDIHSYLFYSI